MRSLLPDYREKAIAEDSGRLRRCGVQETRGT